MLTKKLTVLILFLIIINCSHRIAIMEMSPSYLKHDGQIKRVGVMIFDNAYYNLPSHSIDESQGQLIVSNQVGCAGKYVQEAIMQYLNGAKKYQSSYSNYNKKTKEFIIDYITVPIYKSINENKPDSDELESIKNEYQIDGLIYGTIGISIQTKKLYRMDWKKNERIDTKKWVMIPKCELSVNFLDLRNYIPLYESKIIFNNPLRDEENLSEGFWDKVSKFSNQNTSQEIFDHELRGITKIYDNHISKEDNMCALARDIIYDRVAFHIPKLGRYYVYEKL